MGALGKFRKTSVNIDWVGKYPAARFEPSVFPYLHPISARFNRLVEERTPFGFSHHARSRPDEFDMGVSRAIDLEDGMCFQ